MPAEITLIRHGETAWSTNGRHTGITDLSLVENGRREALLLKKRLAHCTFDAVFVSPLARAQETCQLTGYFDGAITTRDAAEWNYGKYEGLKTDEIHRTHPNWEVFFNGAPGGESPSDVAARADRLIETMLQKGERIALFSHGHFLRALAVRWMGQPIKVGAHLLLSTASVSTLGYERDIRVISSWNETTFLHD